MTNTPATITRGSVVVGYDGSEQGDAALTWAAEYAEREHQPLVVLHAAGRVYYAYDEVVGAWDPGAAHIGARDIARGGVKKVTEQHPGLPVETATSLLTSAAALTEASTRAGMIVVGTRGRGRVRGSLLGSTAFAVSSHAHCPVTVVPLGENPLPDAVHPVLVGVDGSTGSEHAVRAAVSMAQRAGAPLVVACAWRRPQTEPWAMAPPGFDSMEEAVEHAERAAHAATNRAIQLAQSLAPDLSVIAKTVQGRPDEVLHELARGCGLVVLGARGRGDLVSVMLGSTSRDVLHGAPCPVHVVR